MSVVDEKGAFNWVLFGATSLVVLLVNKQRVAKVKKNLEERTSYTGSCHCKAVQFSFRAPKHLTVWDCNCSICLMKKNAHVVVPQADFQLLAGKDDLSLYTFNTHVAKHYFCKRCGVQSFYNPRSNPDGVGVTFACIEKSQVTNYTINSFDGDNWEQFITNSGIQKHSKVK